MKESLPANTMISRYRIISKIGAGGMGEVYRARDPRLGRDVAIKVLLPSFSQDVVRLRRFEQEAQAASALNHPNILSVYDFGEHEGAPYVVSEFLEGETLRQGLRNGALPRHRAIDFGAQIARGLSTAHARGIIHRDLKPENVFITNDGLVKILDFGLAKLSEREAEEIDTQGPTKPLVRTEPGVVMGTAIYMSPEQARGVDVDARSDIFSLGIVLYEMITGRAPFAGATTTDVIIAIVQQEPMALAHYAPEVPEELERILTKALAKDREERYQTIKDLQIDLTRLKERLEFEAEVARKARPGEKDAAAVRSSAEHLVGQIGRHKLMVGIVLMVLMAAGAAVLYFSQSSRSGQPIDSLAVLPFVNVGADPNTEYLSDGITESLINSLSQLPQLTVMSRDSVFRYKGRPASAQAAGRELKVRAVVTGRIAHRGDTLSVSAELVEVGSSRQLWGEQYPRKLTDILRVQEEISREMSDKLRLRLTSGEQKRLTKRYTDNAEAYQRYLKGRYYSSKITEEGLKKGVEYFRQAIELDPSYALAYTGLADSYEGLGGVLGFFSPRDYYPRAKAAAMKALEIDETLAEAHASLATVKFLYDWDWVEAERELARAIQLNPNYALVHQEYGTLLESVERFDDAVAERKRAQELDPLSPGKTADVGYPLYYARRYDQAIEHYRRALELDPDFFWGYLWIGQAYVEKEMYQEAIAEIKKAVALSNGNTRTIATLGHAYAVAGRRGEAQAVLRQLLDRSMHSYVSPYYFALVYTGLGEKDRAFEWPGKAYEERHPYLVLLKVEPVFDSLRSDPRFTDLLRRIGLPGVA